MSGRLVRHSCSLAILSALFLFAAGESLEAAQGKAAAETGAQTGVPVVGSMGVTESVREIMDRQRAHPEELVEGETEAEKVPVDRTGLPQNPLSPEAAQWPPNSARAPLGSPSPLSPQTVGTSFTAATLAGTNPTTAFPPDTMGAVGPTQFITMVNNRIVSFNKTTGVADGVLNVTTNSFFTSVRNGISTSDPRIRYDRLSGRWILVIINVSTPNRILIAVSSVSTITSVANFTFFFIPIDTTTPAISSTCLMDYPTLGVDVNALYIGGNNFCGSPTQTFNSTDGYVVRKSSVLGGGPIVVTVFRGLVATSSSSGPYTPQGVDNYDPAATEGYFIGVDNATFGTLMIRRVSTPGGTPTISSNISRSVNTTTYPISVPHLGNTGGTLGQLDALDDRLFAAHLRSGRLWTAHNIQVNSSGTASATGGRNGTRWYELQNLTGTPTVVQSGTVFDSAASNPKSYWIPSVMVSGQGHAALGFSTAGTNDRANAATVGRLSSDTLGTTETLVALTSSSTGYNPASDNGSSAGARRWGDYSYTSLDPIDDMTMWTTQEFCDATDSYGVRVTKLIAPAPAASITASPNSVCIGASNVDVVITGTNPAGEGFYDPGSNIGGNAVNFSHISATLTGVGVSINSVTYTDSTHVTLNVSVSPGAPVNSHNITITNPDGQQVVGTGILTVNNPPTTATVGGSQTICSGGTTASLGGNTPSSGNPSWSVVSGGTGTFSSGTSGSLLGSSVIRHNIKCRCGQHVPMWYARCPACGQYLEH